MSTATVRVALRRRAGSASWRARHGAAAGGTDNTGENNTVGEKNTVGEGEQRGLPVLAIPRPRVGERAAARAGLLSEARVVFTQGAHLPLAGLLIILPALVTTGLLEAFEATYGRGRNGF